MRSRSSGRSPRSSARMTTSAGDRAQALFARFATKFIRTTTREAELAKLFTNTWRYMKFAVANQFLMIAEQAGVDYTNILRAVREDYPRAADLPGPGFAAGPCLFKDTMQLAAFTTDHFPLGTGGRPGERGTARVHRRAPPRALRRSRRPPDRDPRDGLQGRIRRRPGVALVQAPQAPPLGGCRGARHRPLRPGRPARSARGGPGPERDPRPRRAPRRLPLARCRRAGRRGRVGRMGDGIRL